MIIKYLFTQHSSCVYLTQRKQRRMATPKTNGKGSEESRSLPPYIPFKTFTNFVQKLSETVIPEKIDSSLLRSYPGSVARQLKSTLRYLKLIDGDGNTTSTMTNVVKSFGTDTWRQMLADMLSDAYLPVVDGLNTDTATLGQLQQKFRNQGAEGQMLQKCITFYLSALREAELTFSPHFVEKVRRVERKPKENKKAGGKPQQQSGIGVEDEQPPAATTGGTVKFSFPIPDKPAATIFLPADLAADDWEMIDSMIRAYVQRRTKTKV